MTNVAYSDEYIKSRKQMAAHLFADGCYTDTEETDLGEQFVHIERNFQYSGSIDGAQYNLSGSENLITKDGQEVYRYNCYDNDGAFCRLFIHSNGHKYLVFRRDLYGYSVLDIDLMRDFHYIPATSFNGGETFIWCDIHYNPINNIAAITGCFWACPYGTLLVDFTNPLQNGDTINIHDIIDCAHEKYDNNFGYEKYDDIRFERWDGSDLILECSDGDNKHIFTYKQDEYIKWLKGG